MPETRGQATPEPQPLLISVQRLAHLLSLSTGTIGKLDATYRLPSPKRMSGRLMWSVAEIGAWVAAGCPVRDHWEIVREASHSVNVGIPHPAEHQLQDRLMVRAPAAAEIVGISLREFMNVNARGYAPRALHIGSARLWRPAELRLWIERDYPARSVWELSRDGDWRACPSGNRTFPPENELRGDGAPWLFAKQVGGEREGRADVAANAAIRLLTERPASPEPPATRMS